MINGKSAVFLSCSEKRRKTLAWTFRSALTAVGVEVIIVAEAPLLDQAWSPEEKVDAYLERSDALVALATADDQMADGTWQIRANIADEIGRARKIPHLRSQILVLKDPKVRLPSNINPAYEPLRLRKPSAAIEACIRQLAQWGLVSDDRGSDAAGRPELDSQLVAGLDITAREATAARVRALLLERSKPAQRDLVHNITLLAQAAERWDEQAVAAQMLETVAEIDPALLPPDLWDELSREPNFAVRSSVAVSLFIIATFAPGLVPIDVVARLARPSREDWYVFTPALSCLKELALSRPEAIAAIVDLAGAETRDDREYAAAALLDIAKHRPEVIPADVAKRLKRDPDQVVARWGASVVDAIASVPPDRRERPYHRFGPF